MICSEALVTKVANWFKRNIGLAGGIATCACYPDYYSALGTAMTLPILFGGVTNPSIEKIVRATQAAGLEVCG